MSLSARTRAHVPRSNPRGRGIPPLPSPPFPLPSSSSCPPLTWSMVRPLATNSLRLGMSTPYTLGYTTGGEAEARYTLRAPARRTMSTICGGGRIM